MTAASDSDVIRRGYEAFSRGDMDTIRQEVFAADIHWHQGGNNQTSGDYDGVDAVLGLFQKFFQLTVGTFRVSVPTSSPAISTSWCSAHLKPSAVGNRLGTATTLKCSTCATGEQPSVGSRPSTRTELTRFSGSCHRR